MAGLLDGRLALVTGAGSGIGEGIARGFAAEGARVIVADVNEDGARRVAAEIGAAATAHMLDVTDRVAVDTLAQAIRATHGPISVLVNNAGIIRRGTLEEPTAGPTGTRRWR